MSLTVVDIDYGADVVLLPRDEARQLAQAQTPPDPANSWQWSVGGIMAADASFGPPSLHITQAPADVVCELYRVPTTSADIRPLPAGPVRRWQLRVHHRHRVIVLAPNVPHQTLLESDATQWVRWRAPPDWPTLLGTLNEKLAAARRTLYHSIAARADVFRGVIADDTAFRLLGMRPRAGDNAWMWRADPARAMHDFGLPEYVPYDDWTAVWTALADVSAAERRAVLEWVDPHLVRRHRGRSVAAGGGLWLAERADGTTLAAYEVVALGKRALPTSIGADNATTRRLSSGVTLVSVPLGADAPTVHLAPTAAIVGTVRWYLVWIPGASAPWTGDAAQVRALVTSMCVHCVPTPIGEGATHAVDVGATLASETGAASLLASDTVAFAVLGFDEVDAAPAELPSASLGIEAAAPIPRHRAELRTPDIHIEIGALPAAAQTPFATLAWRQLVGAAIVVAYREPAPPMPAPAPIAAPAADIAIDDLRNVPPYHPPLPLVATAPEPLISNGLAIYRVWIGRDNVRRMIAAFAQRRRVGMATALAQLAALNFNQLADEAGLCRAITGEHDAVWIPLDGTPALAIAPFVLEHVPLFANDRLHAAFVAWAGVCALEPVAIDIMAAHLSDNTLHHIARERNRITSLLRAQQAERRLTAWLVAGGGSLNATDMPIVDVLRLSPADPVRDYVATRLRAYAETAVRNRPPLRHPPRDDETAAAYAARLTVEMLEPAAVAATLVMADTQEAGAILTMHELPISLFPAHWTDIDVHSPLPLAGHDPRSLCAAIYVGNVAPLNNTENDMFFNSSGDLLSLLQLDAADPTRRSIEERRAIYARWVGAFRRQIDIAYRIGAGTPRPLPPGAPLVSAWLRAVDAMPAPVAVLRQLRAQRAQRIAALTVHEERIRTLHTPDGAPPNEPPAPAFFRNGGWADATQAEAARAYFAAYANVLDAYVMFDIDNTRLNDLARRWSELHAAIDAVSLRYDREMLRKATELIRMPLAATAGAPPTAPPSPPPPPPPSQFAVAVRAWIASLAPDPTWTDARAAILAELDRTDRAALMARISAEIACVAPPPPARLTARQQIGDRYNHLLLMFADLPPEVMIPDADTLMQRNVRVDVAEAHAQFVEVGMETAEVHWLTHTYESADDIAHMHAVIWRNAMGVVADSIGFYRWFAAIVDALSGLAVRMPADTAAQRARVDLQRGGHFFRPHPREALFLSAALNTLTLADPDATRDATSLQRAAWKQRLDVLAADASQPPPTALAWTPAECTAMLLARKTPEMLARIAVRWAMRDFVARGPEARFVVPARVLERLLWSLLDAPEFFDARQRYGLDPLDSSSIASALVAVWRAGDTPYEIVDEQAAADALAALGDAAPVAATLLARTAASMQVGAELLWRRVLFGWMPTPSVAATRVLDVRTVAELALFVVALDQQVTAATKRLTADDAALVGTVDRVALLHVCFAWLTAYVLPRQDRIFVQQRHPDGRLVYDDFAAAAVPLLLREVYGVDSARTAIDAAWRQRWTRLAGGWLYGDANLEASRELLFRHVVEPAFARQQQVLWRYTPSPDPLNPTSSLAAGTVSLYTRYDDELYDVSPLAGIDRTPDSAGGRPEGRDIVYNEENNDFTPDAAFAFYEWRVGQDCFLRPALARDTATMAPARRLQPDAEEFRLRIGEPRSAGRDYPPGVELWPDDTPLLRWFDRWAARGWQRRASAADADAVRAAFLRGDNGRLPPEDDAMQGVLLPTQAGARVARLGLMQRIGAALDEARVRTRDEAALPVLAEREPAPASWADDGATVTMRAYRLLRELDTMADANYTDGVHAAMEKRVDTMVRGIELYTDYWLRAAAVAVDYFRTLPTL